MSRLIRGVIHGRTIELEADPGLEDGQDITIAIPPAPRTLSAREDALRAAVGSLSHLAAEDFESLEEIVRERKMWTYRDAPG